MTNRSVQILKYLLGWPFSILAFIFILQLIAPKIPEFSSNIKNLNVILLLCGISCFLLFYSIRAFIWHRLLKIHTKNITYKQAAYVWSLSELRRYIPGNFWAFLGRTILFSEIGVKKKDIGKLVVIEIAIFVLGAGAVSMLALPFAASYLLPWLTPTLRLFIYWCAFLAWIIYIFNSKFIRFFPEVSPRESILLLFLSSIAALFFGIGSYFTIGSFVSLPINLFFQLSGFFVLSLLLGFSSLLTPAGFGIREGITISGLSKFVPVAASALGALFARIVLVLSELIFICFVFLIYKTRNKKFLAVERWIADHKHETALIFFFLLYVFYFTIVSFLRHDNFYTGRFDLGNMAQTVWNTTQGRIFMFTNPNGTEAISRLAFHADYLLVLLAPFYALFPSPKTLLLIQTFVVAAGSFFVYLIARDKLNNKNISLAFAFSFLLSPSLQRANLYDFHPVTLATTFLLATYYFYSRKKYVYFGIFAFLAGISKEQIWVIVALFGILLFFKHKKKLFGSFIFMGSISMFYFLIEVAIPRALGNAHFALSYYSELGDGPLSIIKTIVLSPQKILYTILEKERLNYLIQLFSPVGYLPALFPFFLIFAGPDLLINLMSNNPQLHQLYYHYTAAITPFIYLSSIFAVGIIYKFISKKYSVALVIFIITVAIIGAYNYGPLPGAKDANLDMFTKQAKNRDFIKHHLSSIPKNLKVAASNNIGAHLTDREILYTLPLGLDKADVTVFLLSASEQPDSLIAERVQLQNLRNDPGYQKIVEKEEFVVFKKKKL